MKNLKLLLAGLMVVSFAACGSGGGHDGAKEAVKNVKIDQKKLEQNVNKRKVAPATLQLGDVSDDFSTVVIEDKKDKLTIVKLTKDGLTKEEEEEYTMANGISNKVDNKVGDLDKFLKDKKYKKENIEINQGSQMIGEDKEISVIMYVDSKEKIAINKGTLEVKKGCGMYATNGGIVINYGYIDVNKATGVGMYATANSMAINKGIINLNGSNGFGMVANGPNAVIINSGTINMSGTESVKDKITKGKINKTNGMFELGHDSKGNVAMHIQNHARLINKGQIIFSDSQSQSK